MERVAASPDEYLASLPAEIRGVMTALDERIGAALPGHRRSLWQGVFWGGSAQSIIGYGDYSYVRSDKKPVEWFIVGLARQKSYYSVYVNAADGRRYLTEAYAGRLGKVKAGKSSISFRRLADVELEVLSELVRRAGVLMSAAGSGSAAAGGDGNGGAGG